MPRPILPADANDTWGYDAGRLVYLVKFDIPYPLAVTRTIGDVTFGVSAGECPLCDVVVNKADDWEKHMTFHRRWHYADTHEPYLNGLSHHRHCECGGTYDRLPLWCVECGGYVTMERLTVKPWLKSNRVSHTDSGFPLNFI